MVSITKKDYENIRATLKSLVSYKPFCELCDDSQNEQLLDLISIFDNTGYTFITQLDLFNTSKDDLLEDLILIAEKNVREGLYDTKESELLDIIDKYVRLYKVILLTLDDNEKIRLIQIKFDKQKDYIDKKAKEFESSLNGKKRDIEILTASLTSEVNEKSKKIEEKFNKIENIEGSFVDLQTKINDSYDKCIEEIKGKQVNFEQEIKNKQEAFYEELINQFDVFSKDIIQRLDDINDNVHRKELAGYFLAEKEKLKGKVNTESLCSILNILITIILCLSFSTSIAEMLKSLIDNEKWEKIIPFLLSIVVLFILYRLVKFSFREKNNVKKFWLCTPYWGWLGATIIGMCLIFAIATNIYLHCKGVSYNELIYRLPLFMILVWYTWFCAKQFSYYKQICDEYEYKYLLSMSYLSYRNEAKLLSGVKGGDVLLVTLLDSVIKNISTSPVQSIKSDCYTPFAEIANAMKLTFGKEDRKDNT